MKLQNFILYTLISLITFCAFVILNKILLGFYGLAWGSLLFGIIFLFLSIKELFSTEKYIPTIVELIGLSVISFIFFSKAWIFLFAGINTLYLISLLILLVINGLGIRRLISNKSELERPVYLLRFTLRVSLLLFIASEIFYLMEQSVHMYIAIGGVLLSVITFLSIIRLQSIHFNQNQKLKRVIDINNFHSYWLLLAYIVFFSYRLAITYDITDEVTFNRLPSEYVELFYNAENGHEEPIDGKYEYEIYLENYEEFMDEFIRSED